MEGERPFIGGERRAVRDDPGIIIKKLNMEAVSDDLRLRGGGCQMETTP